MNIGNLFTILLTQPIANLLVACFQVLHFLHVPFALGFSIIALTFIIRLVLYPFTASQIKTSKKMQDMAPHISRLNEKHKDDKKKQQEEMMKLYSEFGVNPAAGCLPVIIQIPIIWSLYHVLNIAVNINSTAKLKEINHLMYSDGLRLNSLWQTTFFGIPLSQSPAQLMGHSPAIIIVPIITGVLQLIFSKMMAPEAPQAKGKQDDFQATFAKQSLFIFPVMIAFFSYRLPFGLSLYWNAFTIFGIIQQYFLVGLGGLKQWTTLAQKIYGKSK